MLLLIDGRDIFTTCSIGISVFPADGMERNGLLQNAGVAMHVVKQQGGNAYRFYSSDLNERSLQYLGLQ
jgi:GGDEF domain-containing protein